MSITFSVLHLSNPPHYFRLKCAPSLPHSLFFCFSIVSIRTISFLPHHLIFLHLCHARLPYHIFIEFCDVFWFPPLFLFLAWTCLYLSICSNFPLLLRSLSLASSFDLPVSRYLSSFSGLLSLAKRKVQLCLFSDGFLEGIKPTALWSSFIQLANHSTLSAQVCHLSLFMATLRSP